MLYHYTVLAFLWLEEVEGYGYEIVFQIYLVLMKHWMQFLKPLFSCLLPFFYLRVVWCLFEIMIQKSVNFHVSDNIQQIRTFTRSKTVSKRLLKFPPFRENPRSRERDSEKSNRGHLFTEQKLFLLYHISKMLMSISRINGPIPGMFVLCLMHFSWWIQIWPWHSTMLTFFTEFVKFMICRLHSPAAWKLLRITRFFAVCQLKSCRKCLTCWRGQ